MKTAPEADEDSSESTQIPFSDSGAVIIPLRTGSPTVHSTEAPGHRTRRSLYLSVRYKFVIAFGLAVGWTALSLLLALPWIHDLGQHVTFPIAFAVVSGIALMPGFMNAFLVSSLLLDRRPPHQPLAGAYPSLSILIAAYKEEANIAGTIESIAKQAYPGKLQVVVINDGSPDRTADIVRQLQQQYEWLELIDLPSNGGKAKALNHGLLAARHHTVVTVDGDSYLYRDALTHIVERYLQDPKGTRAVAGCVLVRNSRTNWITAAQEWDYFHGIASIKRIQSLFQGTLVAQGAFSLYDRNTLREVGGWDPCVGEDIVLTWAFLKAGYRVGHCEDAVLFTNAPETLRQFVKQRVRWSRGMVEAFWRHPTILITPRMSTFFIYWNVAFPMMDFLFTFVFIPGLVAAAFGYYWIAGPMTIALLPLAALINLLMFVLGRRMFSEQGLRVRSNVKGFLLYVLCYSMILTPACFVGYMAELLRWKKGWGTK